MPVRKEKRGTKTVWVIDVLYRHPDGKRERVKRILPSGSRRHAEEFERRLRDAVAEGKAGVAATKKAPKLRDFEVDYLATYVTPNNKPSEVETKKMIFRKHLLPVLGDLRLDEIGVRQIEEYKAAKLKPDEKGNALAAKTVNNHLTVLRRALAVAVEWGIIEHVPLVKWLKAPDATFDFLDFTEADRLVAAADEEWRCMIVVGLKAGLRQGELLALRWEDVDLVAGKIYVRRSCVRGKIGTPKSGRTRDVPIGESCVAALKAHRHLRGELVFSDLDGNLLTKGECKHPLWRACKRAGLRRIGWHVLRHTFASHLVMRGAPIKVVQEMLGHATIEMTMRYAHLSPDSKRDAAKLLDAPATAAR